MKPLAFFLFACTLTATVHAQGVLKGRVMASDTHTPIGQANVYLSNTAIGTVTSDNGTFTITAFPSGRYELVVSFIGYETYTATVFSSKLPASLEVVLKPKVNELQEVVLLPYEKNGWEKWGKFFLENFIGTSENAKQCLLLNKDVVKFRFNRKQNTLQAFANATLLIDNKALGYRIKYDLTRFEYDFTQKMFFYEGYPFFEEMASSRKGLIRRRAKKREDAYYGSLMHFMRSLYRNKLLEDHFEVRRLIKVSDAEKKRVRDIYRIAVQRPMADGRMLISNAFNGFPPDSAAYYHTVLQQPDKLNILVNQVLPGDSIAYGADSVTAGFHFKDYLQVVYPLKKTPAEFFSYGQPGIVRDQPLTSEITLITGQPLYVLANGSYYEELNLLTSGYWAWWEKIGNLLPYDYQPDKGSK